MRGLTSALLAMALLAAPLAADAAPKKKHQDRETIQRTAPKSTGPIRDIDETRYYERLSEKIPFGSATWWRQKQLENPTP